MARGDFKIVGVRYWKLITLDQVVKAFGVAAESMSDDELSEKLDALVATYQRKLTEALEDVFDDATVEVKIDAHPERVPPDFWSDVDNLPFAAVLGNRDKGEWRVSVEDSGYVLAVVQEANDVYRAIRSEPASWTGGKKRRRRRS